MAAQQLRLLISTTCSLAGDRLRPDSARLIANGWLSDFARFCRQLEFVSRFQVTGRCRSQILSFYLPYAALTGQWSFSVLFSDQGFLIETAISNLLFGLCVSVSASASSRRHHVRRLADQLMEISMRNESSCSFPVWSNLPTVSGSECKLRTQHEGNDEYISQMEQPLRWKCWAHV